MFDEFGESFGVSGRWDARNSICILNHRLVNIFTPLAGIKLCENIYNAKKVHMLFVWRNEPTIMFFVERRLVGIR